MYQLKACVWELTTACTMRCLHCGSKAGERKEKELTKAEAFSIADQLLELGCRRVTLIGGEVTLCRYWAPLCRRLTDGGAVCDIITNGYRKIREDRMDIAASGVAAVAVSVDGMEGTHNWLRGRSDSFAYLEHFCRDVRRLGVPLTAVTTITRPCVEELERLCAWMQRRGIQVWQWQQVSPMGNAQAREDLSLRPEEVERVLDLYERLSRRISIVLADNLGYYAQRGGRLLCAFKGCAAGLSAIGIDSLGNVRGCESLYDPVFIEGSLREHTLRELWEAPEGFSYNRRFHPSMLSGRCADCEEGPVCAGGCRSFNAFHGNLYENSSCVKKEAMSHADEKV